MKKEFCGMTFSLADFIREKLLEERTHEMYSIGGIGYEEKDGRYLHVFPVSNGENIYKITVEEI